MAARRDKTNSNARVRKTAQRLTGTYTVGLRWRTTHICVDNHIRT